MLEESSNRGPSQNLDSRIVAGFGEEWSKFDQSALETAEYEKIFNAYFAIFPWETLPPDASGFDLGCGSGRWARGVAARVGHLHCIDPSAEALEVARRNLSNARNVTLHKASVDAIPLPDESQDFGYSLGVLHHVPDTAAGIRACVAKLKRGSPFLVYLYYAFDNRPRWFRLIWRLAEIPRAVLSRSPFRLRYIGSQILAATIYFPIARLARFLEQLGVNVETVPLSAYRTASFYTMRTDALDRFGTRLEKRFTRIEVRRMLEDAGLRDVRFSEAVPYWCAVGYRI